ncbi:serine/threonine-protein kinase KIN4 isoform X2 [Cephus cinctus]|nr:serine/threonine-protein kinase KIN4 isoform X2 [Cephus cinctus]XP_024937097.1 serine/threonine-protein kinase KIN4 isoform X2 [Cephus cinctus]
MVLKALPKAYTGISDFFREFHYGLHLSAHRNIITTYDVAFETAGFYVFSQEYAPLGDLTSNVTETGLGELHAKRVARQLAAAVQHIHSRELVHRDIKLDNILVFKSDFSRIKLCDFGETRRVNTVVRRHNEWLPYSPPEVLQIDTDETYKALTAHDVWQFGIVLFVCLTGCLPWQKAASDDPRYTRYQNWHSATLNIAKKPKLFQLISSRAQRMFKRLLDPRIEKRPTTVFEVNKYLEDRWLAKLGAEKALNGGVDERDELCPSMYSFHSSLEEKNQLLFTLTQYGIETTVDRSKKKDRIREWIQSSAIIEENEEESDSELHEDDEEVNMKGKHFPERRESSRVTNKKEESRNRGDERRTKTDVKPAATKPTERRNPFAPQVAQERQVVAQYASFPNGDPNLAFKPNGVPAKETISNEEYPVGDVYDHYANRRTGQSKVVPEVSRESPSNDTPREYRSKIIKSDSIETNDSSKNGQGTNSSGNSASTSVDGSVALTNLSPNTSTANSYVSDVVALSSNSNDTLEESPVETRSPQAPTRKHRSHTAPFPSANVTGTSSKLVPAKRSQSAKLPSIRPTVPVQSMNPLTMSVASQLVMQSFNSLQAMNVALPNFTNQKEDVDKASPATTATYGKDAYEHYGIAQGVVIKMEAKHRGSTGSGSRSASN